MIRLLLASALLLLCPLLWAGRLASDSGNRFVTTSQILGTGTNDSATSGALGQYLSSATTAVSLASTGNFGNVVSLTLTPGDWDLNGAIHVIANGATVTALTGAISANSANTTTDHVAGDNELDGFLATAAINGGISIPSYRASIAATTVYYLKVKGAYAVTTPQVRGRLSARRVR